MGDRLTLTWSKAGDTFWELAAVLTPQADDTFLEGKVDIRFRDQNLPPLEVPVRAMVRQP